MDSTTRDESSVVEEDNSFLEAFKAIAARKTEEYRLKTGKTISFGAEAIQRVAQTVVWTAENRWGHDLDAFAKHAKRVRPNVDDARLIYRRDPEIAARVNVLFHSLARNGMVQPQLTIQPLPTTSTSPLNLTEKIKKFKENQQPKKEVSMSDLPKHLRITMETMDDSEFEQIRRNILKKLGEEENEKNLPVIRKLAIGSPELKRIRQMTEISSDFDASKTNSFEQIIDRGVAMNHYRNFKKREREEQKRLAMNAANNDEADRPGPSGLNLNHLQPKVVEKTEVAVEVADGQVEGRRSVAGVAEISEVVATEIVSVVVEEDLAVNKSKSRRNRPSTQDIIYGNKLKDDSHLPIFQREFSTMAELIEAFQNPNKKKSEAEAKEQTANVNNGDNYGEFGLEDESTKEINEADGHPQGDKGSKRPQRTSTKKIEAPDALKVDESDIIHDKTPEKVKPPAKPTSPARVLTPIEERHPAGAIRTRGPHGAMEIQLNNRGNPQKSGVPEENRPLTYVEKLIRMANPVPVPQQDSRTTIGQGNPSKGPVVGQKEAPKDSLDEDLGLDLNFGQENGENQGIEGGNEVNKKVLDSFYNDDLGLDQIEENEKTSKEGKSHEEDKKAKNGSEIGNKTSHTDTSLLPLDVHVTQRTTRSRQVRPETTSRSERALRRPIQRNGVFFIGKQGESGSSRGSIASNERPTGSKRKVEVQINKGLTTESQDSLLGDLPGLNMDNIGGSVEIIGVKEKKANKENVRKVEKTPDIIDITHDEEKKTPKPIDLRYCKRKSTTPRVVLPAQKTPMRIKDQKLHLQNPINRKDTMKRWIDARDERKRMFMDSINQEQQKEQKKMESKKDNIAKVEKRPESADSFYNDDIFTGLECNPPAQPQISEKSTVQSKIRQPQAIIAGQALQQPKTTPITTTTSTTATTLEPQSKPQQGVGTRSTTSNVKVPHKRPIAPIEIVKRPQRPQITIVPKKSAVPTSTSRKVDDQHVEQGQNAQTNLKSGHGEGPKASKGAQMARNGGTSGIGGVNKDQRPTTSSKVDQQQHDDDQDSLNGHLNLDFGAVPNSLDVPLFVEEPVKQKETVKRPQKPVIIIQPKRTSVNVNIARPRHSDEIIDHQRPHQPGPLKQVQPALNPQNTPKTPLATATSRISHPPTPDWFNPRGMSTPIVAPSKRQQPLKQGPDLVKRKRM